MNEQTLADVARKIHTHAAEMVAFCADLAEVDLPPAMRQHLHQALARINGDLATVVEETGAAGQKMFARHRPASSR
jgi:hypothetical protein